MDETGYEAYSLLKRNNRFLGIIDYQTLVFTCIYVFGLWNITNFFCCDIFVKIYIVLICTIPLIILIMANINEDNIIYMIYTILKYLMSPKLYVYILD